ncbi:MAG: alpha/beta hydrolase [Candidatus Dormibacteraeota bacterium]|nr:alpha/beta hydrolase [Candidatus Dormibacteraeota bacterium]
MKRVYIVHGWGDKPGDHWIPWLQEQLEKRGFSVAAPAMPSSETPVIGLWVAHLNGEVGKVDEDTYYVGHSIGCQTILRHLEQTAHGTRVRGAAFVSPWFDLTNLSEDEMTIARPWIDTPIDFARVKETLPRLTAYFSPDDPWVPLDEKVLFEERLGARTQVLEGRHHFGLESGMTTFPELLATTLSDLAT